MCNSKVGLTGLLCNEWCDLGAAVFVINLILCLAGSVLMVFSGIFLVCFAQRNRAKNVKTFCNSVGFTLTFVFLGSICAVVLGILNSLATIGFPDALGVSEDPEFPGRYIRRTPQSLDSANLAFFAILDCFILSANVVLPLTWVSSIHFVVFIYSQK
jgi:hypothetical protein